MTLSATSASATYKAPHLNPADEQALELNATVNAIVSLLQSISQLGYAPDRMRVTAEKSAANMQTISKSPLQQASHTRDASLQQFVAKTKATVRPVAPIQRCKKAESKPTNQTSSDLITFPSRTALQSCLYRHPLSNMEYFREKGVLEDLCSHFAHTQMHTKDVRNDVLRIIKEKTKLEPMSVNLTALNLHTALDDCSLSDDLNRFKKDKTE